MEYIMKKIKTLMLLMAVMLTAVSLQSCDTDCDNNDYPAFNLATVTLKAPQTEGAKWYMQLDDSTVIYAKNIASHPYENKELRAYIRYNELQRDMASSKFPYEYSANILTIDTILTKKMDPMVENMAEVYGLSLIHI